MHVLTMVPTWSTATKSVIRALYMMDVTSRFTSCSQKITAYFTLSPCSLQLESLCSGQYRKPTYKSVNKIPSVSLCSPRFASWIAFLLT